ncbi:restriction endonuclease subunit S [Aeromonas enteropelogenes]|uniref:restriction endonuclease subunit S n=1 Tax=Aeromonas enteropelogenes TaxID=29489 RepID=UPI003BA200B8
MKSDWKLLTLGDVTTWSSGGTPKKDNPEYWNGDIPWISANSMHSTRLGASDIKITQLGLDAGSRLAESGSVLLLVRGGALHNRIPVGIATRDVAFNQDVKSLKAKIEFITPWYLLFWLMAHERFLLSSVVEYTGIGAGKLDTRRMQSLPFWVPPPNQLSAIESFAKSLDDRIALLRETNATLEAIAQALFKSWFVDFDPVHARARGEQPAGLPPEVAALFPDSFEESALGMIPRGWKLMQFGEFIDRQSVGKKYDQKSALEEGSVPILDQGKSGVIGFHNNKPSVCASLVSPVVVFANHTCYMRLITFDFSAIQNVLPFIGKGVDTVWAFYATKDRVKFSEYKGHWPEFVIQKTIVPNQELTEIFRNMVDPLICSMRNNELQAQTLANLRDTLLPRLISGQLRLPEAEAMVEGAS